jgi:L-lactate dehydrogenase
MKLKNVKISVIGAGYVGATTAYALMLGGLSEEIVIVDLNKNKAIGEAMDISHGAAFVRPVKVISGDYEDTKGSDIVIITAGAAQKPGESRLDLVNKNIGIFRGLVPEVVKYSPDAIIIVVSNPVDILSYVTYKI